MPEVGQGSEGSSEAQTKASQEAAERLKAAEAARAGTPATENEAAKPGTVSSVVSGCTSCAAYEKEIEVLKKRLGEGVGGRPGEGLIGRPGEKPEQLPGDKPDPKPIGPGGQPGRFQPKPSNPIAGGPGVGGGPASPSPDPKEQDKDKGI